MRPAPFDPPEIHDELWRAFRGRVAWDIGANCGQTIRTELRRFEQVIAFEPAHECTQYLSVFDDSVIVMPIAVSDVDNSIELVELPDKIDTGQLVSEGITGMEWRSDGEVITRRVPARRLDTLLSILPTPDFLKIDVEGHEMRVLAGGPHLIARFRPAMLIEFHSLQLHEDITELLLGHDYSLMTVRHPHYPPDTPLYFEHGWIRAFPA